jgi:hypothetical protein
MMVEKVAVRRGKKKEGEEEEARKHALLIKL